MQKQPNGITDLKSALSPVLHLRSVNLTLLWRVPFSPEGRGERMYPGRGAAPSGIRVPSSDPAKVVLVWISHGDQAPGAGWA